MAGSGTHDVSPSHLPGRRQGRADPPRDVNARSGPDRHTDVVGGIGCSGDHQHSRSGYQGHSGSRAHSRRGGGPVRSIFRFKPQVANALTPEFLAGGPLPNLDRYREPIQEPVLHEEAMTGVDVDLVGELLGQATQQELDEGDLDAWLAHRLHFAIRVPRRIAGDRWFWAWLALTAGRDLVRHRFKDKKGDVSEWRYTGVLTRNALSRLWWGAEMVRNGPDYSNVPIVFRRVRTAQWPWGLRTPWYGPVPSQFAKL